MSQPPRRRSSGPKASPKLGDVVRRREEAFCAEKKTNENEKDAKADAEDGKKVDFKRD